jgi:hypothetical protein
MTIDRHIIFAVNLTGLVLGILGALFFAYDLLDRRTGILQLLLRIAVPTLLIEVALLLLQELFSLLNPSVTGPDALSAAAASFPLALAFGALNGYMVNPTSTVKNTPGRFLRDPIAALIIAAICGSLFALQAPSGWQVFFIPIALSLFVNGLIWRTINYKSGESKRVRLFSSRGFIVGCVSGVLFYVIVSVATEVEYRVEHLSNTSNIYDLDTLVIVVGLALVFGFIGGIRSTVFLVG